MRFIADFRVREEEGWQERAEGVLRDALAEFGIIAPATPSDSVRIMDAMTADMSPPDLANFKHSVRYVGRQFGGPVASVNVLRQGYLRLRIRGYDFGDLHAIGQGLVISVMESYGPDTPAGWRLSRCEIRERSGGRGFLFGAWLPGVRNFAPFLFRERRAYFIAGIFLVGLALELVLSFSPQAVVGSDFGQLGLRLGAPMLVSSTVLILERYAQWLDQRHYRLVWSPRPRPTSDQRLNIEQ